MPVSPEPDPAPAGLVRRLGAALANLLSIALIALLFLAACELAFRLAGFPKGTFEPLFLEADRLYPADSTLPMAWGTVPYVVETNSLGLRGREIPLVKEPGTLRLLTLGDSVTDGFYVDNDDTWQHHLEADLATRLGRPVEAVNGARGGGSIGRELALLRLLGPELEPDLVILTFVTNDVADILGRTAEQVRATRLFEKERDLESRIARRLLTTAFGEVLFESYLKIRSPELWHRERAADGRYDIPGGDRFDDNSRRFYERFAASDGLILGETFSPSTEAAFQVYLRTLDELVAEVDRLGAELLVVYFPAYPQIYDAEAPLYVNRRLAEAAREDGVELLDLTAGFRAVAEEGRVLHLAPADYHLNPVGSRVFARLVAEHLSRRAEDSVARAGSVE